MNRRDFLNLSVITATTAALAGCGRPAEPAFISQGQMPEFYLPGIAQWYATTCTECSAGCGIAVRVIGGRAKKVEGIGHHPLSHGGHCLRAETSLQALYNPDRLGQPWKGSEPQTAWDEAVKAVAASFGKKGGLWITGPLTGTLGALIVGAAHATQSKIWVLDFPGGAAERAAMKAVNGKAHLPYHEIHDADYVVNFGGDFLASWHPNNVDYNWQYGEFRNGHKRKRRGVLVSFSSRMNLTVAVSDKWVPVRPGTEGLVAQAVLTLLGKAEGGAKVTAEAAAKEAGIEANLIERLAERLKDARKAVAIGGVENTAYANGLSSMAAITALNHALSKGKSATFEPDMLVAPKGSTVAPPADLVISTRQALEGLKARRFATVWVNDVNPAYLFPQASLGVADALKKADTFAFTPFTTETSVLAKWVLATTSMLEQWGDARVDGPAPVYGLQQPVALPRPGSKPLGEVLLAAFAASELKSLLPKDAKGQPVTSMREVLAGHFDEPNWIRALERGGVYKNAADVSVYRAEAMFPAPAAPPTSTAMPTSVGFWDGLKAPKLPALAAPKEGAKGSFTLIPYPSPVLGDGSISNRPWAAELPDPMAQAVWTTWVEMNPKTCEELKIKRMDLVTLTSENGEKVDLPVLPSPSVHPEALAIPMGLGHTSFGRYAYGKGYNPMNLVAPTFQEGTDEMAWAGTKVTVTKTGQNGFGEPGQKGWVTTYDWRAGDMKRSLYED